MITINDFSRDEKKALLKSAIMIANADGTINYSENLYLGVLLLRLDGDNSLIQEANSIWEMTMNRIIRNMSDDKKAFVKNVWFHTMARAYGGVLSGNISIDPDSHEGRIIQKMGKNCGIDVNGIYMISGMF